MEFGKVAYEKLSEIDFKLSKEPYTNANVLSNKKCSHPKFYVGLSRWGRKEYIGKLYPQGIKDKDFITEYMKHFNAIEFNATHYQLYQPEEIEKWKKLVSGTEFKFCPKFYQGISHKGGYADKQFLTEVFLNSMKLFGTALGPIFLQVNDKFGPKKKQELFTYLESLPEDARYFLEVRHPDWFELREVQELMATLEKLKIGAVITDTAGRRDACHMHLTIPKTMIRFVADGYNPIELKRLVDWMARINYWVESGLEEVYFFIHCRDEQYAPELAQYLIKGLNEKCQAGLKEINLMTQAK